MRLISDLSFAVKFPDQPDLLNLLHPSTTIACDYYYYLNIALKKERKIRLWTIKSACR